MAKKVRKEYLNIKQPPAIKWLIISTILVICFTALLYYSLKLYQAPESTANREFLLLVFATLLGFIGNLIASILWDFWLKRHYRAQENKNIKEIIGLVAKPAILNDIFNRLNEYNGQYCENWKIRMDLNNSNDDALLKCTINQSYYRLLSPSKTKFRFYFIRIYDETSANAVKAIRAVIDENGFENAVYEFEEKLTDNPSLINVDLKKSYKVNHLIVNKKRLITKEVEFEGGRFSNVILFESDSFSQGSGMQDIEFNIECYMEKESFQYFTIDVPTFGVECSLHFENVKDKISVYANDFINSLEQPNPLHLKTDPFLRYSIEDAWVFPKSTFMFTWYEL